jgi:hypothetical protein
MDQFLSEHGVEICLMNETHFLSSRPTRGGGTAILYHQGIQNCAVPVSDLQRLEATAVHLEVSKRLLKVVAVYLLPTPPLI